VRNTIECNAMECNATQSMCGCIMDKMRSRMKPRKCNKKPSDTQTPLPSFILICPPLFRSNSSLFFSPCYRLFNSTLTSCSLLIPSLLSPPFLTFFSSLVLLLNLNCFSFQTLFSHPSHEPLQVIFITHSHSSLTLCLTLPCILFLFLTLSLFLFFTLYGVLTCILVLTAHA
jgi:hypothetical protein